MKPGSGFVSPEPSLVHGGGGVDAAASVDGAGNHSRTTAVARAVEEEVNAAILSRRASHPDKWSTIVVDPSAGGGADGTAAAAAGSAGAGAGAGAGGESGDDNTGGLPSRGGLAGGGAGIPPRPSTGGGGSPAGGGAAAASKKVADKKSRRTSKGMGSKKPSTVDMLDDVTAVGDGGSGVVVMSKKEKNALVVAEVIKEVSNGGWGGWRGVGGEGGG